MPRMPVVIAAIVAAGAASADEMKAAHPAEGPPVPTLSAEGKAYLAG